MSTISVGIVLYKNHENEIHNCLSSIRDQAEGQVLEVLLRDQGGGDCRQFIDSWVSKNPDSLRIIYSEGKNIGFGGGHNLLFNSSDPSSVGYLCLNPDGAMHPDCLQELILMANKNKWRGIFEAIQEPIMHPKRFNPQTGSTAWCSGACLLIPSLIYKELGGFNEDYFLYCEDVDFSWRARSAGYECFTCGPAYFHHYAMDRAERASEIWRSACILAHKWRSTKFKSYALENFSALMDVCPNELQTEIERYDQYSVNDVYRAAPNFRFNLVFAEPMWG